MPMASEPTIDFERILTPIDGDNPAGEDIREDFSPESPYFGVKDLQNSARTEERKRRDAFDEDVDTSFQTGDWDPVLEAGEEIQTEKAKDLEVAAWMAESMMRLDGFAGLRDGFRLIRELSEKYWDDIYPRPDEDGVATTIAAVTSLNGEEGDGTLIWPISNIPITNGGGDMSYTSWHHRQAFDLQGLDADKRQQRVGEGAVSMDLFQSEVSQTSASFFIQLLEDIKEAEDEFKRLGKVMDEKCGQDETGYPLSPPTSRIQEAITETFDLVEILSRDIIARAAPDEEEEEEDDGGGEGGGGGGSTRKAGEMTRESAFRELQKIAGFFKRTEPHSPISYLLEQTVRWGGTSLPELLNELISDNSTRDDLFRQLGLPKADEEEN